MAEAAAEDLEAVVEEVELVVVGAVFVEAIMVRQDCPGLSGVVSLPL